MTAAAAVLGEALVDAFVDGTLVPGGAPFNVARWLAAFGVPTLFITRLGDDAAAQALRAEMQRVGLADTGVQADTARPTGRVQVLPTADGHRFEIEADSAWDHIDAPTAVAALQAAAPAFVCYGSLALRQAASRTAILQGLQATPALRVLDLNLRAVPGLQALAETALDGADWVKLNDEELGQLQQWFAPGCTAEQALPQLARRFAVQRFIVTCGARGWYSARGDGQIDAQGAAVPLAAVADTVGAGDSFTATVLAGQARGWPLQRSLEAANRLAGAVCTWQGALPADSATIAHWRQTLGFAAA
jgi:fructokinase